MILEVSIQQIKQNVSRGAPGQEVLHYGDSADVICPAGNKLAASANKYWRQG